MEVIEQKDSYGIIKQNYKDFGYYANATRALASDVDGLKTVYRRTLWTALEYPKGKMIKSAVMVGSVLRLHPHGEQSGVLYSLVNSKLNLFDKQGNFGSRILPGSAPRYTECRLNDNAYLYLGQDLVNHCEMIEGDLGYLEPRFLPTLIPYILVEGNSSMGVGVSSSIPPMDMEDLVKFYRSGLMKKDHETLKLDLGSVTASCTEEEISSMLAGGRVSGVRYGCKVTVEGTKLVITDFPPGLSPSKIHRIFEEGIERETIDFRDESNSTYRLVYEVIKGDIDYYLDAISKVTSTASYDIVMTGSYDMSGKIVYTNLHNMREKTLTYLKDCAERKFSSEIAKLTRKLSISQVIKYLKDNDLVKELPKLDRGDIVKLLPFDKEAVEGALAQSITKLMKGATEEEILSMERELKTLEAELANPDRYLLKLYDDLLALVTRTYKNQTRYKVETEAEVVSTSGDQYVAIHKDSRIEIILSDTPPTNHSGAVLLDKIKPGVNYFMLEKDRLHGICVSSEDLKDFNGRTVVDDIEVSEVVLTGQWTQFKVCKSETKWFMPTKTRFNRKKKVFKRDIQEFVGGIL